VQRTRRTRSCGSSKLARTKWPVWIPILLLPILLSSTGFAQSETIDEPAACVTDAASFWVCLGDPAWATGYLIPPDVLDLREVQVWQEQAELVPELVEERDTFRKQRDDALIEVLLLENERDAALAFGDSEAARAARAEGELAESFDTLDVALIAGGTGVAALVVGLLIGGLAI